MNTKKSRKVLLRKTVKNAFGNTIENNLFSTKKNMFKSKKNKTLTIDKQSVELETPTTEENNNGQLKTKEKTNSMDVTVTLEKSKDLVSKKGNIKSNTKSNIKSNMQNNLKSNIQNNLKSNIQNTTKSKNIKETSLNKTVKLENYDDFNMDTLMLKNTIKELIKYPWYHGLLPRDDVLEFLVNEGDFLVRKSEVNNLTRFVLSVKWKNNQVSHIVLNWHDGMWYMSKGEIKNKVLDELLKTCLTNQIPIGNNKVILQKAIVKPPYYIDHQSINIIKEIGHGAFGVVCIGTFISNSIITKCAIKSLKLAKKIDKNQRKEFIKEAKINLKLKHENIVNLHGFAVDHEPLMIVLEFCENGALNSYLKKFPETSNTVCTNFVIDACRGMCYLASKNIIHRDLAARNCLIDGNLKVKISDFGLSVANVVSITLNAKTKVPIKWLSPETIREKHFNLATDVWSFGVVIWEIFSRCQSEPYPKQTNTEAKEIIISGNKPMNPPPNTPKLIAHAMDKCFTQDPKIRPNFGDLMKHLSPNEIPPGDANFCTY